MKSAVRIRFKAFPAIGSALRARFAAWREEDPVQAAALKRVGKFFAAMLLFTLIARGTAGATMPVVTTAHPAANIVEKDALATGTVSPEGNLTLAAPEGLLISRVLVQQGQSLAAGDAIALLDAQAVDSALAAKKAELAELAAKLAALNAAQPVDSSALETAQLALTIAQDNYNALAGESDPDEDALRQAAHAVQQAKLACDQASRAYQQQAATAGVAGQESAAAAQTVQLEIKAAKERIQALQNIQSNAYQLVADTAGTVQTLALSDGGLTVPVAATLSDAQAGLVLRGTISAENAEKLAAGAELTVQQGTTSVMAHIAAISAQDDAGMVTLTALLEAGALKSGEAQLTIPISRSRYELTVPIGAVHTDNGGSFVYCIEQKDTVLGLQNVLVRIPVTVLQAGDTTAAVSGALAAQDTVVVSATKPLSAGARVRVTV